MAILPGGEVFGRSCEELTARLVYVDFNGGEALMASEEASLGQDLPDDFCSRPWPTVIKVTKPIVDWANQ